MNNNIVTTLEASAWVHQIIIILFFGVLASWGQKYIAHRLAPRLAKTSSVWDDALLHALSAPYQLFVWLFVVSLIIPVFFTKIGISKTYISNINQYRGVLFILSLIWFCMRFITNVEHAMVRKTRIGKSRLIKDDTSVSAVAQIIRVIVIIISALILVQTFGGKINSVLAFGSVGAIAVGFAARDTLANFLGGMMVYWDRPFSVGDWIRSPDREIEGTVENIGWRLTRIRTLDKRPLYVPNGVFSTVSVENPSRMTNRRIKATIGLRYQDASKIKEVLEAIEKMLLHHPEIDLEQTLLINLVEFGPFSLNCLIYTFTKTTEWVKFQAVQQDIFLKTIEIITQHGAECAFPTTTLDIPKGLPVQQ